MKVDGGTWDIIREIKTSHIHTLKLLEATNDGVEPGEWLRISTSLSFHGARPSIESNYFEGMTYGNY